MSKKRSKTKATATEPVEVRSDVSEFNIFSRPTSSEINITEGNVYQVLIAKACIELISNTIAGLSHAVYKRSSRKKIDDHPVQLALLNPNDLHSGFTFKQTLQAGVLTNGNGPAFIERIRDKITLLPLPPRETEPKLNNGFLIYETVVTGKKATLEPHQVFHLQGLGNGIKGMSPIQQAKAYLETSQACVEFGKSFFENGATVGGFITTTKSYKDPKQAKVVLDNFNMQHRGARKAFKVGLLEEGSTFTPVGIPPEQAQFLQTRQFTDKQIASQLFQVPLHMLGLEPSSANSEQRGLEFLQFTLYPWLKRWEQEINRKLFTEVEKKEGYYFEFNVDSLLRADIATRYQAYSIGRNNGWLNINEIRAKENMDSIGEKGDIYLTPLNMVNSDQIKEEPGEDKPQPSNEPKNNPNTLPSNLNNVDEKKDALRQLVEQSVNYVLTKEINKLRNAVKRNFKDQQTPEEFKRFIDGFYESYAATIRESMKPVLELSGADIDKYAADHIAESRKDLALALWDENPSEALEKTIAGWGETRATTTTNQLIGG